MKREQRNLELQKARQRTLEFVYYIQHELGYKNLGLADDEFPTVDKLPFVPYHREGRRLKGITRMTINDVLNRDDIHTLYRTGISVGDYPVDHHHACNPNAPDIKFPPVPSFNIPLGALIPERRWADLFRIKPFRFPISSMVQQGFSLAFFAYRTSCRGVGCHFSKE